jgi:hypothetical protein
MEEAFRFLTTCCCSAGWVDLAARMEEAFRFLIACCCSAGWVDLAAHMEEAFCFLIACCCLASWTTLAARLAEASRSLTACCYSAAWAALAARLAGYHVPSLLVVVQPSALYTKFENCTLLSHTHYVCEAPPNNPLLLLLLASCIVATHINSFSLSFLPSFFPYYIATTNNINSS